MDNFNQTLESSIDEVINDREALALRNKTLAEAIHQPPFRHRVRRLLLSVLANTYVPPSRTASSTDRILLIRPDHLGDLLLTTPAIAALRHTYPNREIHALVGPWSAGVLENSDLVDLVLTVPFPGFTRGRATPWRSPYRYAFQTARRLRRIGYSEAIIFRPDHWWGAWLARLTGIPRRVGYDHVDTTPFLTETIQPQHEHAVRQSLRLAEALTGEQQPAERARLHFNVLDVDRAFVTGYLSEWGHAEDARLFCIHPGAGTGVKQWVPSKWAETADILSEQLDAHPVFTGSDQELGLIREIVAEMKTPYTVMAGDTTLSHLAALYERTVLVLGPDSGPLHIATATGTPTVTLYGPADTVEFGPWGPREQHMTLTGDIGCLPCRVLDWSHDDPRYHPCVRDIPVTDVLTAARLAASHQA